MNRLFQLEDHKLGLLRQHAEELAAVDRLISMTRCKFPTTLCVFDQGFHDWQNNRRLSHGVDSTTAFT